MMMNHSILQKEDANGYYKGRIIVCHTGITYL